jgi:hypothetical protein
MSADPAPPPSVDPRCSTLCAPSEPRAKGAFAICSAASATTCVSLCETRIAGVPTVCAGCLLEGASFAPDGLEQQKLNRGSPDCSPSQACPGSGMACVYVLPSGRRCQTAFCLDDLDGKDAAACARELFPRTEVDCQPTFRSVQACADVCADST